MYHIGIDVGSTYTKYCIMNENNSICNLITERTPIRQKEYFLEKLAEFSVKYQDVHIVSCGYGKGNVAGLKTVNELTSLARGSFFMSPESGVVLDIGGQDIKVICQKEGKLERFFVNDRCAAGSGMFLYNTAKLLKQPFKKLDLTGAGRPEIHLSSVCAVFAQSEIVGLMAEDAPAGEVLRAVIWQILTQARSLLGKVDDSDILLSGGLTQIKGFREYAQLALERECTVVKYGSYLSAIGCSLMCT